jgi:hypothetical protein
MKLLQLGLPDLKVIEALRTGNSILSLYVIGTRTNSEYKTQLRRPTFPWDVAYSPLPLRCLCPREDFPNLSSMCWWWSKVSSWLVKPENLSPSSFSSAVRRASYSFTSQVTIPSTEILTDKISECTRAKLVPVPVQFILCVLAVTPAKQIRTIALDESPVDAFLLGIFDYQNAWMSQDERLYSGLHAGLHVALCCSCLSYVVSPF